MTHGWKELLIQMTRRTGTRFYVSALLVAVGTGLFWNCWYRAFSEFNEPSEEMIAAESAFRPAAECTARAPKVPNPAVEYMEFVHDEKGKILLCQACGPAAFTGVSCDNRCGPCEPDWNARQPLPWEIFAQGEYIGPARSPHVNEYRLRPGDQVQLIYRLTRERIDEPYELNVGDEVKVESLTDASLDRTLVIQPDGTVTLRLLNQVPAAGRTVEELRLDLEERYKKFYKVPSITVTPTKVDTKLEDLRAAIRVNFGTLAQGTLVTVTPEGTIQLPGIGSVFVQGLTMDETKHEIDERYRQLVHGIEITPSLLARAPRFVYVLGEVKNPGQYTLTGPTTVMQSIALAGGWNVGGNLRQIVVFRRNDDWRLMATKLDLAGALYGQKPCPADEIWVRDVDIVLVPKNPILRADDWISLIFGRGIYGVYPLFLNNTSTL